MGAKDISLIVEQAKNGDSNAFAELFELTQEKAYYTALKITKHSEDAQDILQEAYVKAFTSLESLKDNSKFVSWFNCIVANKARNYIIKKKPDLFSQYNSDDSDLEFEDMLENKDESFIPHEITDNKETKRLIMECIERLPEDQKICIIMYYYDEMSVKDIASSLGISEGTVKSRLNLGRQKLKKDFKKLEEKGTKLYGIGLVPLILLALRLDAERVKKQAPFFRQVEDAVLSELEGGSGAFASSAGLTGFLTTKVIAAVVIASIVIASIVGGIIWFNRSDDEATPVVAITEPLTSEPTTVTDIEEESYHSGGAFAVCDRQNNLYYLTDNSVMLEQTNGDKKIIFDGKANNLVYTDRLYFISKGKLYSYDDILNESAEVNSYTIYYINDETLLGINNKKTKAYIINLSESTETEIIINGTDISFENDYLYYRDTNQNVLRISPMSPDNVETVVQYDSDKRMKTPFYAFGDIVFFSDFSSDETGNIYLRRSGADGKTTINLGNSVIDFSVGDNSIYYSDYNGDLYTSDLNGNNRQLIARGSYGFSCSSGSYQIWYNADSNTSVLIRNNSDKIALTLNGCITNAQIVNGRIYYQVGNSIYQWQITEDGD